MESLPTPINSWREKFVAFFSMFFAGLARREVTEAAQTYLEGLLRPLAAKNCWTIAEASGASDPQAHQRLLRTASWDEATLGQARRRSVAETLGESEGMLIFDETGFVESGDKSVGVGRQYSGTAGKIGNCQVAVFGAYTSSKGRTLYDTRLYLPEAWTSDRARRHEAGIPDSVEFATKAELAGQMLDQAVGEELPVGWVVADTVYGANFDLRQKLIDYECRFVMEVPKDTTVYKDRPLFLHASPARGSRGRGRPRRRRIKGNTKRVDAMADDFASSRWTRIRVANGSKGPRVCRMGGATCRCPRQKERFARFVASCPPIGSTALRESLLSGLGPGSDAYRHTRRCSRQSVADRGVFQRIERGSRVG